MDKVLDKLLQARVHSLLIVAGIGLLFVSLLDLANLENIRIASEFSVVRFAAMGIGALLLIVGVVIYLKPPHHPAATGKQPDLLDLQGKTIVFTGTLKLERDVLAKQAGRLGATFTTQVTGNTDYLIAGTKPGANKIKAAGMHNVAIVSADQWYATVNKLSR